MEDIQILLVEDNPADAELISRLLTKAGLSFTIRRVSSESSFRRELVAGSPDIILSDYQLPAFDGISALAIARTLAPEVPFIFVSGAISDERATRALQEGAIDYIVKDRPTRLPEAVRRAIAERRDGAERRGIQAALRLSEQRFHLAALATLDVIWDYDVRQNRVLFNDAVNTLWGYELDGEVDFDWWLSRIHPDDAENVVAGVQRVMESRAERWTSEYRFRRADGTYGNVLDRGLVARGEGGRAVRMIGAMQDFTERKAAELRAAGAERLAHLGYWTHDFNTGHTTWSHETYRILGLPPATTPTFEGFAAAIHPEDRDAAVADMLGKASSVECRVVRPDGEIRVVHARLGDAAEGKLVGTIQDITDRAEAERTIRSLSRQNELILQHAAEGIIGVDPAGKLTFVNRAAVTLAGWPDGDLLPGVLSHSIIHADGICHDCGIEKTLADGELRAGEEILRRRDGELRDIEYSCTAIRDDEGRITGAVVTFRDVTSRKRLERQLDQVRRVSSLGRIAATIAHELNNVLMGISPF
ncbi:MAG TPA: PAS domain-containing protein, partial [Thermoanaerobaculia bacterium]|nr:PAS domain-containing protein [Thermoanaerobaculia bacterium]